MVVLLLWGLLPGLLHELLQLNHHALCVVCAVDRQG